MTKIPLSASMPTETFCLDQPAADNSIPRSIANPLAITMQSIISTSGSRIFLDLCAGF